MGRPNDCSALVALRQHGFYTRRSVINRLPSETDKFIGAIEVEKTYVADLRGELNIRRVSGEASAGYAVKHD